jgi:hypothetical protein
VKLQHYTLVMEGYQQMADGNMQCVKSVAVLFLLPLYARAVIFSTRSFSTPGVMTA